jgi:PleD family two-component response regulator
MKMHNMPTTALPVGRIRVLIADSNEKTSLALAEILQSKADYEVQTVQSNFGTGAVVQKFIPHVLLISLLAESIDALNICKGIRSNEDLRTIKMVRCLILPALKRSSERLKRQPRLSINRVLVIFEASHPFRPVGWLDIAG